MGRRAWTATQFCQAPRTDCRRREERRFRCIHMRSRHPLLWLAIVLIVAWIVLRLALAVTGGLLHILWIAAIIFLVLWLIGLLRGRRAPRV